MCPTSCISGSACEQHEQRHGCVHRSQFKSGRAAGRKKTWATVGWAPAKACSCANPEATCRPRIPERRAAVLAELRGGGNGKLCHTRWHYAKSTRDRRLEGKSKFSKPQRGDSFLIDYPSAGNSSSEHVSNGIARAGASRAAACTASNGGASSAGAPSSAAASPPCPSAVHATRSAPRAPCAATNASAPSTASARPSCVGSDGLAP